MYRDSENWMKEFGVRMQKAKRYIKFCVSIYNYQREMNRYFVHEHPWLATSWNLDFVNKLLANDDVQRVQRQHRWARLDRRRAPSSSQRGS